MPSTNWNDEFLESVRPGVDRVFGRIHDESCEILKAEVAQAIKEVMTGLNQMLKSNSET